MNGRSNLEPAFRRHIGIDYSGAVTPETQAWNRKMNRNHVTIDWRFTCRKAQQKFGYRRHYFMLSETSAKKGTFPCPF